MKIHQVVFEISQVTFSPVVALFLLAKNKNANYILISLGISKKKKYVYIPADFGVRISNMKSNFLKKHKKAIKKQH